MFAPWRHRVVCCCLHNGATRWGRGREAAAARTLAALLLLTPERKGRVKQRERGPRGWARGWHDKITSSTGQPLKGIERGNLDLFHAQRATRG
jgi:hypothetical protein